MKTPGPDRLLLAGLHALNEHGDDVFVEPATNALKKRDFAAFFIMFESHYRLQVFQAIKAHLTDGEYWPLLGDVWQYEEIFFFDKAIWLRLLASPRAGRENIMEKADRDALERMPAELEIFRGYTGKGQNGLSWTLSEAKADWFTLRANTPRMQYFGIEPGVGKVIAGKCRKSDVFAYFSGRKEEEIVVDPRKVYSKHIRSASPQVEPAKPNLPAR